MPRSGKLFPPRFLPLTGWQRGIPSVSLFISKRFVQAQKSPVTRTVTGLLKRLREQDLNLRPSGYEPDELPDCSIPRFKNLVKAGVVNVADGFGIATGFLKEIVE